MVTSQKANAKVPGEEFGNGYDAALECPGIEAHHGWGVDANMRAEPLVGAVAPGGGSQLVRTKSDGLVAESHKRPSFTPQRSMLLESAGHGCPNAQFMDLALPVISCESPPISS